MEEMKMEVMKAALRKAAIVNAKGQMTKEAKWKLRRMKNRFGDVALFELWDRHKWPENWYEKCGFCGKTLGSTKIHAVPLRQVKCFICWDCYKYGKHKHCLEGLK